MLLIISNSKKNGEILSDTFRYMSILSYVVTPKEALSEISNIYKGVLIIAPESYPDIKDYLFKLKGYMKSIPVFALTDKKDAILYELFDIVFEQSTKSPYIASEIVEYCVREGFKPIGYYKLAGFDASADRIGVSYFYSDLNFTKTEAMILRYLISTYPTPQTVDDILRHAFKPSRTPESASIRTHISAMNKKLQNVTGRKHIELYPHKGYYILTPEISERLKNM